MSGRMWVQMGDGTWYRIIIEEEEPMAEEKVTLPKLPPEVLDAAKEGAMFLVTKYAGKVWAWLKKKLTKKKAPDTAPTTSPTTGGSSPTTRPDTGPTSVEVDPNG